MPRPSHGLRTGLAVWLIGMFALLLAACGRRGSEPPPRVPAAKVIELHSASLMAIPGVVGVYEGRTHDATVIRVMLAAKAESTLRRIPTRLDGYPVEIEVSGKIVPM